MSSRMGRIADLLTPEQLRVLDDVALVSVAVDDDVQFKRVVAELETRPASEAAARRVVEAYRDGEAAPWLTAVLLGTCRHELGYSVAREILLAAPGQLAESYAGPALARIRGEQALEDLSVLMMTAPKQVSREGAAYGLEALGGTPAKAAILEAGLARQIRWQTAGWILGKMDPDEGLLLDLLASADSVHLGLGTELLWSCSRLRGLPEDEQPALVRQPSAELLRAVEAVLEDINVRMSPLKRDDLRAWAAGRRGG